MKYPKLVYGFIAVLGAAFVIIFFSDLYLYSIGLESILTSLSDTQLGLCFVWFCLLGGTFFLKAGIVGIRRQYLMNSPNPFTRRHVDSFTIVVVMIILSVVFGLFLYFWMGALTVGY